MGKVPIPRLLRQPTPLETLPNLRDLVRDRDCAQAAHIFGLRAERRRSSLWRRHRRPCREAQAGEVAVTCTNPFSGASWRIAIDYDRRTVDSNPARISDTEISWRDATNGWNYTLDRKSGKLTVILASATGGNFLYDRCGLAN